MRKAWAVAQLHVWSETLCYKRQKTDQQKIRSEKRLSEWVRVWVYCYVCGLCHMQVCMFVQYKSLRTTFLHTKSVSERHPHTYLENEG